MLFTTITKAKTNLKSHSWGSVTKRANGWFAKGALQHWGLSKENPVQSPCRKSEPKSTDPGASQHAFLQVCLQPQAPPRPYIMQKHLSALCTGDVFVAYFPPVSSSEQQQIMEVGNLVHVHGFVPRVSSPLQVFHY